MRGRAGILALDVGSSSVRARVYDERFEPLLPELDAVCRYRWHTAGGAMECDPEALLACTVGAIDQALVGARAAGVRIEAVAPTTFWHGVLGLGAGGEPLTPLYGWGDSRAAAFEEEIRSAVDDEAYHARTGCFLTAVYPVARLFWLARSEPELFARVRSWCSFGDYLELRLFGSYRSSLSIASATGLLDRSALRWDAPLLELLDLDAGQLPELVELTPQRGVRAPWAARWPELAQVPWFPALGDGACANLGSGAIGAGLAGLTIGTSAAVRVIVPVEPERDPPPRLWEYRLDRHHRVVGNALSNGGSALVWLLELFPELDAREVSRSLEHELPDGHGLTVLPHLTRERGGAARWPGGALVTGLHPESRPLEIVTAWLEAIAHRLAERFELLEAGTGAIEELRASGGALHAVPGWVRTCADALERPVRLSRDPEATCRGAALLAARELGWIDSLFAPATPLAIGFEPDPARSAIHRAARIREARLMTALAAPDRCT